MKKSRGSQCCVNSNICDGIADCNNVLASWHMQWTFVLYLSLEVFPNCKYRGFRQLPNVCGHNNCNYLHEYSVQAFVQTDNSCY